MGSVRILHNGITLDDGTNQDCIDYIEHLLDLAKSGEIVSIFWVGLKEDGSMVRAWASHKDTSAYEMLGAIEAVKMEFVEAVNDDT